MLVKSIREAKLTKFFFLLLLLQIQRQEFIIRIRNKRVNGAIFLNCYKKKKRKKTDIKRYKIVIRNGLPPVVSTSRR